MQAHLFDPKAPKKIISLSINSDLLRQAKENGISLSQVLELRLAELLREEKCRQWQKENQEAIDDYNRRIQARGTYSDGVRRF